MKPLKIDVLANDGSPLGVTVQDIYGEGRRGIGVGGAELGILTLCEEWAKRGYRVCFYNNPISSIGGGFQQKAIAEFNPEEDRDFLITFRTPVWRTTKHAKGRQIFFSCDQYTSVDFNLFLRKYEKVVVISEFHRQYFEQTYHFGNAIVIDLPVRVQEYAAALTTPKIQYRCLFSSVPDRGLMMLHPIWPFIYREIPEATLVITSDYRLWGLHGPQNERFRMAFINSPGVTFLGAIPRRQLVQEQMRAEALLYPCTYDELFCYAVAEAQCAGAFPFTTPQGALGTTNMAQVFSGNPTHPKWAEKYIETVVNYLKNPEKEVFWKDNLQVAQTRFSPQVVLDQWDRLVFN